MAERDATDQRGCDFVAARVARPRAAASDLALPSAVENAVTLSLPLAWSVRSDDASISVAVDQNTRMRRT